MGMTTKSISFFSDEITIIPHSFSKYMNKIDGQFIGREVSIREFSQGQPCSLEQVQETGEYIVRLRDGSFMHGPEC